MVFVSSTIRRIQCCLIITITALLVLPAPPSVAQRAVDDDYFAEGVGFYSLGLYDKAIRPLQLACALDRTNARAHYYLANCYMKLFQVPEAISEYTACLQSSPDTTTASYCREALAGLGYSGPGVASGYGRSARTSGYGGLGGAPGYGGSGGASGYGVSGYAGSNGTSGSGYAGSGGTSGHAGASGASGYAGFGYGVAVRPTNQQRLFRTARSHIIYSPGIIGSHSSFAPLATVPAPATTTSIPEVKHFTVPKLAPDKLKEARTGLGYQVAHNASTGIITSVTPGGPAWYQGVRPGDELVAGDIELSRDATAHLVVKHHSSTHTSNVDVVAEGVGARIESASATGGARGAAVSAAAKESSSNKSSSVALLPPNASAVPAAIPPESSTNNTASFFKLNADESRLAGQTAEDDLLSRALDGKRICILVDCSASMDTTDCADMTRWQWCQQQVQNLGNHVEKALPKPAQILLFSDGVHDYGMLPASGIAPVFQHNKPHGGTYLGNALETPLEQYRLEPDTDDKESLLLVVITDGEPSDGDHVRTTIAQAMLDAKESKKATADAIETIFFCIGNDRHGQKYLAGLRAYIEQQTGVSDAIRIVPFETLQQDGLLHCLLSTVTPSEQTQTADTGKNATAQADTIKDAAPTATPEQKKTPVVTTPSEIKLKAPAASAPAEKL